MNKTEYINELGKRLKYLPKEDRDDAIEYYNELISDMGFNDTEDVAAKLGSAKDTAKKILDECTQKHVEEYNENKNPKSRATVIWLTILGILSLPVSVPLAITVLVLAFAVIVVILALIFAISVTGLALTVAGAFAMATSFAAPGLAQTAVVFGVGTCSLGLGILVCFGVFFLIRGIIRKIFRRNASKAEVVEGTVSE